MKKLKFLSTPYRWNSGKCLLAKQKAANQKFQNLKFCMQLPCKGCKFAPFRSISNRFWEKCKFKNFELLKNFEIFVLLKNVFLWSLKLPVIPKFCTFHSISYGFWVLNFKFKNLIFFKMATIRSVLTRFLPKTNQRQF